MENTGKDIQKIYFLSKLPGMPSPLHARFHAVDNGYQMIEKPFLKRPPRPLLKNAIFL